ncbi:UDP-N-acetylglucosamine: N-acetylmuramyl-(pentapeptide) pyrophosphoryl-undecaprenolN-acetylglucosamine transferase [Serratia symbiotica]|nr:UDP-N-acetylglucosamine: N-acetylmuramyl-(pentapeptide) pyrophosphoryl-undecaprenolN-acetylglucosamine transferase [Serratia symbiotica]
MSINPKRLMVMAGGTGGHVFPGLTVAHYLIEKGWQVRWLGSADRVEADLVPKHGIEIDFIRITGLRGKSLKTQLTSARLIWQAVWQAQQIMRHFQPDVVLGMGGYVSGPGGLAAWLCGIPVIVHEQNGIPGLTNRFLARIAKTVLQAFPGAFPNAEVVGNPLRRDVLALPFPTERLQGREGPIRVLVIGGSQGALILNQTVPQVAARLGGSITLWHQVGKNALDRGLRDYERAGQAPHKLTEFIDDMASAYAWADVVVCRAGALTVSEVAAAGLPAIFVPFQHPDRQQHWNALPLAKAGAAKVIEQTQFNADSVCELLASWHRPILLRMAEKARAMAIPAATERVAAELIQAAK